VNKIPNILKLFVLGVFLLESCAGSFVNPTFEVDEPTEIAVKPTESQTYTPSPTPTKTPLPSSTATVMPTQTFTPIPVYSELGKQINEIVDILGWDVVTCKFESIEKFMYADLKDLDQLLYREDTQEYFCDLSGYMEGPVPQSDIVECNGQWVLTLTEFGGMWFIPIEDGIQIALTKYLDAYFPYPAEYNVSEIFKMNGETWTPDNKREERYQYGYVITFRMWPLTIEEVDKILDLYNQEKLFIEMVSYDSW
jgi:hypothetical protein